MAPKVGKKLLKNALEKLSQDEFKKFVDELLDRGDGVTKNQVEGKGYLDVADVLVSVYTDKKAVSVTEEIFNEIRCSQHASDLVEEAQKAGLGPSGAPVAAAARPSTFTASNDKHFVDKYRTQLINRVTNIGPILDRLLDEGVLKDEAYTEIKAKRTSQDKIRALYEGPVKSAKVCKDIFYSILKEEEMYLISELEGN